MAAPALASLWKWAVANPSISIPIGTTLVSGLKELISPNRQKELINDVINSQQEFRDRLARHAFGNFTAIEREQIRTAAEPQVNMVAGNVASRGLGTSGAGAQIIAQAQQAPFLHAQQHAMQQLPAANASLLQASQYLLDDNSFFDDLLAIARELELANKDEAEVNEIAEHVKTIYMGGSMRTLDGKAGPIPGMPPQKTGQGYVRQKGGWL